MKRLLLFLFLGCSLYMSADDNKETKTVTTYYGAKASGNANNPCKGATTRICAVVETTYRPYSETVTAVTTVTKDENGEIISMDFNALDIPFEDIDPKKIYLIKRMNSVEIPGNDE